MNKCNITPQLFLDTNNSFMYSTRIHKGVFSIQNKYLVNNQTIGKQYLL